MKCRRPDCPNEAAEHSVYCSAACQPTSCNCVQRPDGTWSFDPACEPRVVRELRAEVARLRARNKLLEAVREMMQRWMNRDTDVDMSHVSDAMDACDPAPEGDKPCANA